MKHSNVFYIRNKDNTFTPCKAATKVKNDLELDIFRYKGLIYEGNTGVFMFAESELSGFLNNIRDRKKDVHNRVNYIAGKYGLSPRYTQPTVKKDDLFPRDDNRKLARTLYHKGKCYFHRVHNENGIELYTMAKEKASNPLLFALCNGWMIGIGYELEKVLDFLQQPDFNLYNFLVERFETSLTKPEKWADTGIGEFLERRKEADEHNQPIQEMRRLERIRQDEEWEAERHEREEQEQLTYQTAIADAEKTILDGGTIENTQVDHTPIILHLFRANGIDLPLRTQGWINSSLINVSLANDKWTYTCYGKGSKVFPTYLNQLANAIEQKQQCTHEDLVANEIETECSFIDEYEDDMEI